MYAYLLRIGYKPRNEPVAVRRQATRFLTDADTIYRKKGCCAASQLHQKRKSESLLDLLVNPHASLVAREEGVSFSKVWRLAERECVDLAAGRAAKGCKRLPAERRAAVIEARRINPEATQAEIAGNWREPSDRDADRRRPAAQAGRC